MRVGRRCGRWPTSATPAGAAKAHTVHATTLARLGRFGECEAVLDLAKSAARDADDRRRITASSASAPHATLWGPSPVSRAGGRCLDIIRLLRITTDSPAVEATSIRCQAVLEAFRGRADAARRMLRRARRMLTSSVSSMSCSRRNSSPGSSSSFPAMPRRRSSTCDRVRRIRERGRRRARCADGSAARARTPLAWRRASCR